MLAVLEGICGQAGFRFSILFIPTLSAQMIHSKQRNKNNRFVVNCYILLYL